LLYQESRVFGEFAKKNFHRVEYATVEKPSRAAAVPEKKPAATEREEKCDSHEAPWALPPAPLKYYNWSGASRPAAS
jgi:hypothetical protein